MVGVYVNCVEADEHPLAPEADLIRVACTYKRVASVENNKRDMPETTIH